MTLAHDVVDLTVFFAKLGFVLAIWLGLAVALGMTWVAASTPRSRR